MASRLARTLLRPDVPLGVPMFAKPEVPALLVEKSARGDARDLGEGLVFASQRIDTAQELNWSVAQGWPEETMSLLLLVDLWLQNEDRSLSALGGNPNLLVEQPLPSAPEPDPEPLMRQGWPGHGTLWAYDFNLAFDEDFDRKRFFAAHVFGGHLKVWPAGFRERMEPCLRLGLAELDSIFDELPLEWLHVDGDESLPVQLDRESVKSVLEYPFTDPDSFWRPP